MDYIDIERAIEEILSLSEKRDAPMCETEEKERHIASALRAEGENENKGKSRRGRKKVGNIPIWAISDEPASKRRTLALISMCIKEEPRQSLSALAERVSELKQRPYGECLAVLRELRKKGELGYYNEALMLVQWTPGRRKRKGK
ncbi:MAG: hypothetical protein E7473_06275 [Ruminococcaceae bacterium]|nr:hypothetical protein [Oscillospiraceae bacterium]